MSENKKINFKKHSTRTKILELTLNKFEVRLKQFNKT